MSQFGIAFEEAIGILKASINPIDRTKITFLEDAHACVLAQDIVAQEDVPSFESSAMDGYAVNLDDYQEGDYFKVVGKSLAGHPFNEPIGKGEAVRVFTGSVIPKGTDAVVIQEDVEQEGERICFTKPSNGNFIRKAGINLKKGDTVCEAGTWLDGRTLSQISAVGVTEVEVYHRLKVGIANTGDEIIEIGRTLKEGQIYNTNKWYLTGRIKECAQKVAQVVHIEDSLEATRNTILNLVEECDIVIITGGASVGDADFVRIALRELAKIHFDKVASRPGKPIIFSTIDATPVFSLPGNPVSVAVSFEQLVKPVLGLLQGRSWQEPIRIPAISESPLKKQLGRTEFQRAIYRREGNKIMVNPINTQDSAAGSSILKANCFIVIEAEVENVEAGSVVTIEPFNGHYSGILNDS